MIPRILLMLAAYFAISSAVHGLSINKDYPGEPAEITVERLQELGQRAPSFLHIEDITPAPGLCLTETYTKEGRQIIVKHTYVPLATDAQLAGVAAGDRVSIPAFAEYDECTEQTHTSVQGVIEEQGSLDRTVREKFASKGILAPDGPVIVHAQYVPTSFGGNLAALAAGLIAALAGIVPFFKREKWPKEAALAGQNTESVLAALYPVLKMHGHRSHADFDALLHAMRDTTQERVLLRINATDESGRPALAVLSNRRYLFYRTKSQWFLILLKALDKMLDKVPGGGLVGLMLEPFAETYEVLITPQEQVFREAMGYSDEELLSGSTPWKKTCDMSLTEVVKMSGTLRCCRAFWSDTLKVEFMPRKLAKLFSTPPDFQIKPRSAQVAIGRVLDVLCQEFEWLAAATRREAEGAVEITLPDHLPAGSLVQPRREPMAHEQVSGDQPGRNTSGTTPHTAGSEADDTTRIGSALLYVWMALMPVGLVLSGIGIAQDLGWLHPGESREALIVGGGLLSMVGLRSLVDSWKACAFIAFVTLVVLTGIDVFTSMSAVSRRLNDNADVIQDSLRQLRAQALAGGGRISTMDCEPIPGLHVYFDGTTTSTVSISKTSLMVGADVHEAFDPEEAHIEFGTSEDDPAIQCTGHDELCAIASRTSGDAAAPDPVALRQLCRPLE